MWISGREADGAKTVKIVGRVVVQGGAIPLCRPPARRFGWVRALCISSTRRPWSCGPLDPTRCASRPRKGWRSKPLDRATQFQGSGGKLESVTVCKVRNKEPDAVGRPTGGTNGKAEELKAVLFVGTSLRRAMKADQPDLGDLKKGVLGNLVVDSQYRLPSPAGMQREKRNRGCDRGRLHGDRKVGRRSDCR